MAACNHLDMATTGAEMSAGLKSVHRLDTMVEMIRLATIVMTVRRYHPEVVEIDGTSPQQVRLQDRAADETNLLLQLALLEKCSSPRRAHVRQGTKYRIRIMVA